jgi:uncharacterized protein YwgA
MEPSVKVSRAPEPLQSADLVLLLVGAEAPEGAPSGRLDGITRLEKLLFLVDKETDVPHDVDVPFPFRPYNYGPYSREVYEAVELLEEARLVEEERVLEGNTLDEMEEASTVTAEREGVERRFRLTDHGRLVAGLLARQHPDAAQKIADVKRSYAGMPLQQLIRYVYRKYPEYAEQSKIRDQVL